MMHGLLDCSASWFMHVDKYTFVYEDQRLYRTCSLRQDMMFGLETTEATEFHMTIRNSIRIIGSIISII